jgi:microcystin-dependent protein
MAAIPQNLGVPTGTVLWSAAPEVPVGWLLCDGRFVTPGSYPGLFAYLGTTYGGDGVNTFGLPDLVGRFVIGVGDPGRDPFTYEDGINQEHLHGMFANVTHTHGVTDNGHEHPTSSGSHVHSNTSNHPHKIDSDHRHRFQTNGQESGPGFSVHAYTSTSDGDPENYNKQPGKYPQDPEKDFFVTDKYTFDFPGKVNPMGKTGITQVQFTANTGISVDTAFTGVTLDTQVTGITLLPAETGITVDDTGVVGGPRPSNIAMLPIIRT